MWRNEAKYFREINGRARMQTCDTYLAWDRFLLDGDEEESATVDRAEYSAKQRLDFGKDYWFSFQVNVHHAAPTSWFLVNQFHDVADAGAALVPPPFAAMLLPNSEALSIVVRSAPPRDRATFTETEVYRVQRFERGRWHNFVYCVRFERGAGGFLRVWHDGRKVVAGETEMGYNDKIGPYFKFGAYRDPTSGNAHVEYANVEASVRSLEHRAADPATLRPRLVVG